MCLGTWFVKGPCYEKKDKRQNNTRQVLIFGGGEIYGVKSEDPFYSPSHGGLSRRKSHTHVEKGARCQGSGSASEKFATTKVTNK